MVNDRHQERCCPENLRACKPREVRKYATRALGCASGKLGVEHFVNLSQARVGGVRVALASDAGERQDDDATSRPTSKNAGEQPTARGMRDSSWRAGSVDNFEAVFFDDGVGEHFF